jgi:hypothetical protein
VLADNHFIWLFKNNKEESKIDLNKFREILHLNLNILEKKKPVQHQTYYKKLSCLYDKLRYGF